MKGHDEKIFLVPHSSDWLKKFELEKKLIEETIGPFISGGIHHVGSTAILGMSAKPIIDIMVGVESLDKSRPCIKLLEKLDYNYYPYKSEQMHWFVKPSPEKRTHHLHLIPSDSKLFRERLVFRDYLIANKEVAREYEKLKQDLAKKFRDDREAYTEAKSEFRKRIIDKEGASVIRLAGSLPINEDGKFLLIRRKTKDKDQWETVGGGIEKSESAEQAAIREAKEELEVEIELGILLSRLKFVENDTDFEYSLFSSKIISGIPRPSEDEHIEVRYWNLNDLRNTEEPLSPNVQSLLRATSSGKIELPK